MNNITVYDETKTFLFESPNRVAFRLVIDYKNNKYDMLNFADNRKIDFVDLFLGIERITNDLLELMIEANKFACKELKEYNEIKERR